MRSFFLAIVYALRDYRHEALLSACSVLGLAAALAPLLVLLGVHHGVISAMTEKLLNDPRTLEVTPVGSGKYGPAWFREVASLPEVAFVLPQTRSIAATVNLNNPAQGGLSRFVSPLIATAEGDPFLARWNIPAPRWKLANHSAEDHSGTATGTFANGAGGTTGATPSTPELMAVFSESMARKLQSRQGDTITLGVDRVKDGKRESESMDITVLDVLPPEAYPTDLLLVPLELLVATEDYRDGKSVPFLGWGQSPAVNRTHPAGSESSATVNATHPAASENSSAAVLQGYARQALDEREYASFRLYAKSLDDVSPLWRWFQAKHIEVYVKSAEIENVRSLDRAFTLVFGLISGAALFGLMASTASSALAGVRRKSRSLGIMRLMGISRWGILFFPIVQTLATALFGTLLAYGLYLAVALSIDRLFASSLPGGEAICSLPPAYLAAVFGIVLLLSALASVSAAWQAAKIEPSEVIRDV